jgi:predicted glycoside hydrolase/deacetylase ChbG (UPF0249 family)
MANAPHAPAAALHARGAGTAIGCHIILLDGVPVLPPSEIPSLVDPQHTHSFRLTLGGFVSDLLRGRIRDADIEAEAVAQITLIRQMGIAPTHIDTHKHAHIFPRVLRPLLRAALRCGIRAIRNPFEQQWSTATTPTATALRRLQIKLLNTQRTYFLAEVRRSGLATTDGALGILATGTLDAPTIQRLLKTMPDGTWELVCHPGYVDAQLTNVRTRLLNSRETERHALLETIPNAAQTDPDLSPIHFGNLTGG